LNKNPIEKPLFPNEEVYQNPVDLPDSAQTAINSLEKSILGNTQAEQIQAKQILQNWSKTLWQGMIYITHDVQKDDRETFRSQFETALSDYISDPDHGITHSLFVYLGMHHLIEIDQQNISETQDQQLQLLALLHDAMQTLPFSLPEKTNGILAQKNQKNEHARIIGALTRLYGKQLGFDQKTTRALAFGLKEHDSTYNGVFYPNGEFTYLSKLLHDADKLYGASNQTDTEALLYGMLLRNFEANRGMKGSYLIRTELDAEYRSKIKYGDRAYSDSLAVIFRELELPMYTPAGKAIAQERKIKAIEAMHTVYGDIFDQTAITISKIMTPAINGELEDATFSIAAIGHPAESVEIQSQQELHSQIETLYEKPLILPKKYQRNGYEETDARGWKLLITVSGKTYCIDPSIARFCIQDDGRQLFLDKLTEAFYQQFPDEEELSLEE
jgi:hypothetical protein